MVLMSAHARLDPGACLLKSRQPDRSGRGSERSLNGGLIAMP